MWWRTAPNIPDTLAESILFGHERGAFTDAKDKHEGLISMADRGVLFFDEVGDLNPSTQRSLLRVIQEKRYRPLGSMTEKKSHCRFISATNRDIDTLIREGSFRSDLFYRLATFQITIPPLRERSGDIPLLVRYYVERICEENRTPVKDCSQDFFEAMTAYGWPGNVRELVNVLHVATANAGLGPCLFPHHLPTDVMANYLTRVGSSKLADIPPLPATVTASAQSGPIPTLKEFRERNYASIESEYLDLLLGAAEGNARLACRIAGISRSRLYQLLEKHKRSMRNTRNEHPRS